MRFDEHAKTIDPALASRVAALSPGGQKWLKTAIQTIRTLEDAEETEPAREPERAEEPPRQNAPDLEDVITGKVDLKDLEDYPELDAELEGLGEIIDMLRGLGEARRQRGEEILREDILGQTKPPERENGPELDEEDFSF